MSLRIARLVLLALTLTLVGTLLPAAASAQVNAAYRDRVGFGTHVRYDSQLDIDKELIRLREGGVTWIREDFRWDQIEPREGSFDWRLPDKVMLAAARTGVDVLPIIDYSAPWASSDPTGGGDMRFPPSDPATYATYARTVVERYGPGGGFWAEHPELTPRPLRAIEVWNEPYGRWYWKPDPAPAAYARLVRLTSAAVRGVAPGVKILASGDLLQARTDGAIVPWLEKLLEADPNLGDAVDGWTIHPYPGPRNLGPFQAPLPSFGYSRLTLSRDVAAARGALKPLWITEVGWSTAAGDPEGISELTQAQFLRESVQRAIKEWGVERIFLFSWDKTKTPLDQGRDYGMRRADNTTRPAWDAVRDLLVNRAPSVSITAKPSRARPGRPVALTARTSDLNGDEVRLRWDLDGDGAYDDAVGAKVTVLPAAKGVLPVSVEATDPTGARVHAAEGIAVTASGAAMTPAVSPTTAYGATPASRLAPPRIAVTPDRQPAKLVARKGLALWIGCPATCSAEIEVSVGRGVARRLGGGKAVAAGGNRTVRAGRARKQIKAPGLVRVKLDPWLRRRLAERPTIPFDIRATFTDSRSGRQYVVQGRALLVIGAN